MQYRISPDIGNDEDLTRRAFAAYFKEARGWGEPVQPSNGSGVVEHDGKTYVVLLNSNGTLAVYRVRNSGALKRLRRWPTEVAAK
jgi:hypothetical protein